MGRLAVFVGGWRLDALQQVCGGNGFDAEDIATVHAALLAEGWIVGVPGDPPRYRMPEAIRGAATHASAKSGDLSTLLPRHAQWCLAFVEAEMAEPTYVAGEPWLHRLDPEIDNLRAALAWARTGDAQIGVRLVSALVKYWHLRGLLSESLGWATWAVADNAHDAPLPLRARVLRQAAMLHRRCGAWQAAEALVEEAVALDRSTGGAGAAIVARHYIDSGCAPHAGYNTLDASVAAVRSAAEVSDLAQLLWFRGQSQLFVAGFVAARRDFDECVALGRREGRGDALLLGLLGLARVDLLSGDYPAAARELTDARSLADHARDIPSQATALALSAELSRLRGDYGRASSLLGAALDRDRADGEALAIARDLLFLGRLEQATGSPDAAASVFQDALDIVRSANGSGYQETLCLLGLAASNAEMGDVARAHSFVGRARTLAEEKDDRLAVAESLRLLSRLERTTGHGRGPGIRACREALKLFEAIGGRASLTACLEDAAILLTGQRSYGLAARLFGAAATLRDTGGYARPPVDQGSYDGARAVATEALGSRWGRAWLEGRTLSPGEAVSVACDDWHRRSPNRRAALTPAEREVARLVANGLTNAEAADRLLVSCRTIEAHLAHLYAKLGIHSRAELCGWTDDAS